MSSSPLHLINPPPPRSSAAVVRRRRPSLLPPLSACRHQSPCRRLLSKKGKFYSQRGDWCGSDILPKCRGLIWTHVAAIDGGGSNRCGHGTPYPSESVPWSMQVLFLSTEVFCTSVLFGGLAHSNKFCWALSNQKRMSYLAKKKSLTKRAYTDHKFYKKV
jgi:hypothetical protein